MLVGTSRQNIGRYNLFLLIYCLKNKSDKITVMPEISYGFVYSKSKR